MMDRDNSRLIEPKSGDAASRARILYSHDVHAIRGVYVTAISEDTQREPHHPCPIHQPTGRTTSDTSGRARTIVNTRIIIDTGSMYNLNVNSILVSKTSS